MRGGNVKSTASAKAQMEQERPKILPPGEAGADTERRNITKRMHQNAPRRKRAGLSALVILIFQNVPRLAIQRFADGVQRGEADGADFAGF